MSEELSVSVAVPTHNGGKHLDRCLDALRGSSQQPLELFVVDDGSSDNSAEIGRQKAATVLQLHEQSGPAAARNFGARQSTGKILFFVDSDVVVKKETLERLIGVFQSDPGIAAVFGSYDDRPAEKNFFSQYKNLFHHYVHQKSDSEAATFWAGCGAIRRDAFRAVGGFDPERYPEPSIEDIELGLRLRLKGYRIVLDKKLQVQHLKRWTLLSLVRTDIFSRALPWRKLILETSQVVRDLNLKTSDRISAGLACLGLVIIPLSLVKLQLLYVVAGFSLIIVALNWRLYRFFRQKKGLVFTALAFPVHQLYYIYSAVTFAACWCTNILLRKQAS